MQGGGEQGVPDAGGEHDYHDPSARRKKFREPAEDSCPVAGGNVVDGFLQHDRVQSITRECDAARCDVLRGGQYRNEGRVVGELVEHGLGRVGADDLACGCCQSAGVQASAAADVGDDLSGLDGGAVEDAPGHPGDVGRAVGPVLVVAGGQPS